MQLRESVVWGEEIYRTETGPTILLLQNFRVCNMVQLTNNTQKICDLVISIYQNNVCRCIYSIMWKFSVNLTVVRHQLIMRCSGELTVNKQRFSKLLFFQVCSLKQAVKCHPFNHPSAPHCSPSDFPMHFRACQHSNNSPGWSAQQSCSLHHVIWLFE